MLALPDETAAMLAYSGAIWVGLLQERLIQLVADLAFGDQLLLRRQRACRGVDIKCLAV